MLAKLHTLPKRKKRRPTTAGTAVSPKKKPTRLSNPDGSLVDWRDEDQVRAKVVAQWDENWNQPSEYIENRVLAWIRELEQISAIALEGNGEEGPDYDLAARIRLSLIKLSSVDRQRVDLTARVAMTSGPDLSNLSEAELRAIELGDDQQLNELALRIGNLNSRNGDR